MLYFTIFIIAILSTYLIKNITLKRSLLDIPNERSSHKVATPHGGGIAILSAFLTGLIYFYITNKIDSNIFFALMSVLPISIISLIDDFFPLSAKFRFSIQLISSILALYFLGGVNTLEFDIFTLDGIWINLFALLLLLWMVNLFNFLDGIDGYAASEAIFVSLGAYILFESEISLLIAFSTLGFLFFNWHKASIFMGDVGSASLGFIFGVLILSDASDSNFLGWIVLLSLFWSDATYTLYKRFRNGEKLSQAHNKHAFQRLYQAGFSHDKIVLMAMSVNIFLLITLYFIEPSYYWLVLIVNILILYAILKYVKSKKAFE